LISKSYISDLSSKLPGKEKKKSHHVDVWMENLQTHERVSSGNGLYRVVVVTREGVVKVGVRR
jgi:hypothetical protein